MTRVILRNWLFFGTGLGVLGALQVYVATERLDRALWMVGVGLLLGIIAGLGRLAVEWRRGGLDQEPDRWPSLPLSRVIAAIAAAAAAIGAGFARAADAPVAVYVALIAIAAVVSLLSLALSRDSRWTR